MVLELESSSKVVVRTAKLVLLRSSQPTPGRTSEGRTSGLAPSSEPPPSPPRLPSPTPAQRGQAPGGGVERLLRMLQSLGGSDGPLMELPSPTPPPVLRRTLSQGGYQPAVSGVPGDRNSQRGRQNDVPSTQHEVKLEALSVTRHEMPAEGGGGSPTTPTRSEKGRHEIYSICYGFIEGTAHVQASSSCDLHCPCALGVCEDAIPSARYAGGAGQVTCPNLALHEEQHQVDLHPLQEQIRAFDRSVDTTEERVTR